MMQKFKYKLSIVAILKEEEPYVAEWIEFHLLSGIEHFYLYDNSDDESLAAFLKYYVDRNVVSVIPFPGEVKQIPAYNHAIENFKNETQYMAMIDGDEFLMTVGGEHVNLLVDALFNRFQESSFFLGDKTAGGLGVNWRCYGYGISMGVMGNLVTERCLFRFPDEEENNNHIKSIVNPRSVTRFENPHFAIYKGKYVCISEKGSQIVGAFFPDGRCDYIRINHYLFKSKDEYIKKNMRGRADVNVIKEKRQERIDKNLEFGGRNLVYDPIALRYAEVLKERLQEAGFA